MYQASDHPINESPLRIIERDPRCRCPDLDLWCSQPIYGAYRPSGAKPRWGRIANRCEHAANHHAETPHFATLAACEPPARLVWPNLAAWKPPADAVEDIGFRLATEMPGPLPTGRGGSGGS